jgi:MSHA biogenesis protein MshM
MEKSVYRFLYLFDTSLSSCNSTPPGTITILLGSSSYLKHFHLNRFPFRQQPDPEVFFAEAGRGEILQNLCADIADGKPLVRLTGSEGTGKTLIYLLVARKLGIKKFEVVCLDHPVGAFEDLLGIICRSLNDGRDHEPDDEETTRPGAGHLPQLLALLRERNRKGHRVVLLIDEAEQLFMATLERLVRLIADIGQDRLLQIVLIGRQELDRNLQQLSSFCDHVDIHPGYSLVPLDLQETGKYLCFRLAEAGGDPEKVGEIFSEEAVSALHQAAKGNLGLTNLLAEQGLVRAFESGMFRVGADLVSPRQDRIKKYPLNLAPLKVWLQKYRLQALAGSLLVLALLLVSLRPEGEESVPPVQPMETVVGDEKNEPAAKAAEKKAPVVEAPEKRVPVKPPPKEKPALTPAAAPPPAAVDRADARSPVREGGQEGPAQPEPQAENTSIEVAVPPSTPEEVPTSLPEPAVTELQPGSPPGAEGAVTEPPSLPEKNTIVLEAEARKRKVAEKTKETKQPAGEGAKDPEQLFTERMRASSKWRSKSGYTIQLMALASETAEENFKGLLAQERYAAVKDQLYVVRKEIPPTLFVYYGFFETMEKARQERGRLPEFLQRNKPYPVSVDEAARKAKN